MTCLANAKLGERCGWKEKEKGGEKPKERKKIWSTASGREEEEDENGERKKEGKGRK